jgi:hypothetical protein
VSISLLSAVAFLTVAGLSCAVSSVFKLDNDVETPFVIIVWRTVTGAASESPFTITVESEDYGMELTEILEKPPQYREEMCAEILRKYEAPGKVGLLTASPLEEIIAVLEQHNSMFIDPSFPPSTCSLNDQPNAANG